MREVIYAGGKKKYFTGLYGRFRDDIKRLNNSFMEIAPSSLMYQQKYNLTDNDFQDEISGMIRRKYFGDGDIDESDKSRFGLIDVSSNLKLANIYIRILKRNVILCENY